MNNGSYGAPVWRCDFILNHIKFSSVWTPNISPFVTEWGNTDNNTRYEESAEGSAEMKMKVAWLSACHSARKFLFPQNVIETEVVVQQKSTLEN